jgi:hypothetical protein
MPRTTATKTPTTTTRPLSEGNAAKLKAAREATVSTNGSELHTPRRGAPRQPLPTTTGLPGKGEGKIVSPKVTPEQLKANAKARSQRTPTPAPAKVPAKKAPASKVVRPAAGASRAELIAHAAKHRSNTMQAYLEWLGADEGSLDKLTRTEAALVGISLYGKFQASKR